MTENLECLERLLPDAFAWSIELLIVTVEVCESVDVVVDIACICYRQAGYSFVVMPSP